MGWRRKGWDGVGWGGGGLGQGYKIYTKILNLAETSTVCMQICLLRVSDIAPSWSSCFGYILTITGSSGHLSQPIISTSARGTRDSLPGVLLKPGETKDCKNGRGSLTKMAPMQLATLAIFGRSLHKLSGLGWEICQSC